MIEVYHEEIMKEVQEAGFLAVIADETNMWQTMLQLAFRYISKDKPVERFGKFINPIHNDAQTLASYLMQEINEQIKSTSTKLIVQSDDGVAVMGGSS